MLADFPNTLFFYCPTAAVVGFIALVTVLITVTPCFGSDLNHALGGGWDIEWEGGQVKMWEEIKNLPILNPILESNWDEMKILLTKKAEAELNI